MLIYYGQLSKLYGSPFLPVKKKRGKHSLVWKKAQFVTVMSRNDEILENSSIVCTVRLVRCSWRLLCLNYDFLSQNPDSVSSHSLT